LVKCDDVIVIAMDSEQQKNLLDAHPELKNCVTHPLNNFIKPPITKMYFLHSIAIYFLYKIAALSQKYVTSLLQK